MQICLISVSTGIALRLPNPKPKAQPTADPRDHLRYGLPAGSGFTLRVKLWCCWGGLNSRPRHYQSKGSTAGSQAFPTVLGDGGCVLALDPRQTQTVRSSGFSVFLLKVLWSNKIGKSDLRRTYGRPAVKRNLCCVKPSAMTENICSSPKDTLAHPVNLSNLEIVCRGRIHEHCIGGINAAEV
jgi:hypothetical protein